MQATFCILAFSEPASKTRSLFHSGRCSHWQYFACSLTAIIKEFGRNCAHERIVGDFAKSSINWSRKWNFLVHKPDLQWPVKFYSLLPDMCRDIFLNEGVHSSKFTQTPFRAQVASSFRVDWVIFCPITVLPYHANLCLYPAMLNVFVTDHKDKLRGFFTQGKSIPI